jgi:hypothetical protein
MTEDQFWTIIERACDSDSRTSERWKRNLVEALTKLPPDEIVEWNHVFDRLVAQASTNDLLAACILMNAGGGADGFYYFRCWLVGMGKQVYYSALASPDSLVSVALPYSSGVDAEAEIYSAAHIAWLRVTGNPDTVPYPARNESAGLAGECWDLDNADVVRKHLPRLSAFYNR